MYKDSSVLPSASADVFIEQLIEAHPKLLQMANSNPLAYTLLKIKDAIQRYKLAVLEFRTRMLDVKSTRKI